MVGKWNKIHSFISGVIFASHILSVDASHSCRYFSHEKNNAGPYAQGDDAIISPASSCANTVPLHSVVETSNAVSKF
jgi:hypothetical protein